MKQSRGHHCEFNDRLSVEFLNQQTGKKVCQNLDATFSQLNSVLIVFKILRI